MRMLLWGLICWGMVLPLELHGEDVIPFAVEVVDGETGRGIPLVELETVNHVRYVTDSNGFVAITDPDLIGQRVFFFIRSHGYETPADGFGMRGKAFEIKPGEQVQVQLKRRNIAERLYRTTGGGIYRDSILLGKNSPIDQPLINGQVWGCDSILCAVYQGKIYWFWGDTSRPSYPLGNFHTTGATSLLPKNGGLDPMQGINYTYFSREDGFVKGVSVMPGDGPTWISGITVLRDEQGQERMYASYLKIRNMLEAYKWGIMVWNDERNEFEEVKSFDQKPTLALVAQDHPFHWKQDETDYVYFSSPFPLVRVRATPEAYLDPNQYEAFTCLQAGTRPQDGKLDRKPDGSLNYAWKQNTPPLSQKDQERLIRSGAMKPEEALIQLQEPETGHRVQGHRGSVYWNDYRQRWVMIVCEEHGESSYLGEIWYAEADSPVGPWVYAKKIVTHEKYTFYNPKHHPFLDQKEGRILFFEGTYTNSFSGNPVTTPRYDYNQVMYQLDLEDPRLNLPVAVYRKPTERFPTTTLALNQRGREIAFFALDRPGKNTIPLYERSEGITCRLTSEAPTALASAQVKPLFHALPANLETPPENTLPLYEFRELATGNRIYSTATELPGFEREFQPLCLVWKNPLESRLLFER